MRLLASNGSETNLRESLVLVCKGCKDISSINYQPLYFSIRYWTQIITITIITRQYENNYVNDENTTGEIGVEEEMRVVPPDPQQRGEKFEFNECNAVICSSSQLFIQTV
jgi:hypothetical protein